MKVLGICGSPRRDGNTAFLLKQALLEARELGLDTQLCNLSELSFRTASAVRAAGTHFTVF
jgi:multimeric flavodoxin WrbA